MEEIKPYFGIDSLGWGKEDDDYLKTLVSIHGTHDWEIIASNINMSITTKQRTAAECRDRWTNSLDPAIAKKQWTDYEDAVILRDHQRLQNRWADIASRLKDRTGNAVKNRFYSIFRKVKTKVLDSDFSYDSKCELMKILYVLSLMEYCFKHPQTPAEQRRNKDKNFIYSLLRDVSEDVVLKFKTEFCKRQKREARVEDLWVELTKTPEPVKSEPVFRGFDESRCVNKIQKYILPQPRNSSSHRLLSADEKAFVRTQAFQPTKEPWSAGSYVCQPMLFSPPVCQMTAFSAAVYPRPMGQRGFDGFSDFVAPMEAVPTRQVQTLQPMIVYAAPPTVQFQQNMVLQPMLSYPPSHL